MTAPRYPSAPLPPLTPSDAPAAPDRRLVDILAGAIAEHEREMVTHSEIERLQFFRRSLHRLAVMIDPSLDLWIRHPQIRTHLQSIVDTTKELRIFLSQQYALNQDDANFALNPLDVENTPSLIQRLGSDSDSEGARLDLELESVLFEVLSVRDVLSRDQTLPALLRSTSGTTQAQARQEISGIDATLYLLQQNSIDALGRFLPHGAPFARPAAPAPKPRPSTPALPAQPSQVPFPPFAAPQPPASAPFPPFSPQPPAQHAPLPALAPNPPPAQASPATGLALSDQDEDAASAPPAEPDTTHRSEEEAVKFLQAYFEDHSPEGTLPKVHDPEFAALVQNMLQHICPDASFSQNDLTIRLRQLKDTLALRKKLHNTMTLAEFKAYFRKSR